MFGNSIHYSFTPSITVYYIISFLCVGSFGVGSALQIGIFVHKKSHEISSLKLYMNFMCAKGRPALCQRGLQHGKLHTRVSLRLK